MVPSQIMTRTTGTSTGFLFAFVMWEQLNMLLLVVSRITAKMSFSVIFCVSKCGERMMIFVFHRN